MTLKSQGRVTLRMFMKEPEESSKKILKYVQCEYVKSQYVFNICLSCKILLRLLTINFNCKDGISQPPTIQNRRNSIQIHPHTPCG